MQVMIESKEHLRELMSERFKHDFWANTIWIDLLARFQKRVYAQSIMERILQRQEEVLAILDSELEQKLRLEADLHTRLATCNALWQQFVEHADLTQVIEFCDSCEKQSGSYSLYEILNNTCLGGTYRRGKLAQLALDESPAATEWLPNTGPLAYIRATGKNLT